MHASIFGKHVVEANFELHKLSVVFSTCVRLLLALHKPRLQIGKCCDLNHDIKMFFLEHSVKLSQPHFGLSVRMKLTLPKVGTWSPSGLPKTQSSISGVKTPCIAVFFIPMERS
jgi:hypothetical protein